MQTMDGGRWRLDAGHAGGSRLVDWAALEIEPREVVADKGCHSNATMKGLKASSLRSYVSEPDRGRAQLETRSGRRDPTYANRPTDSG